jgi:pyrimidine-nucleoside phosphorylase
VEEALEVLRGHGEPDLVELTLVLGGEMLVLGEKARTLEEGREKIAHVLRDGTARARLENCIELQGGNWTSYARDPSADAIGVTSPKPGYVLAIDAEAVGHAAVALGAGRLRKEDAIDHQAWIYLTKKVGEKVEAGDELVTFSAPRARGQEAVMQAVRDRLAKAYTVEAETPASKPLILEVIR